MGHLRAWTGSGCAACRPVPGSPRRRRPSARWPSTPSGGVDEALELLTWAQAHRRDDGSYWTGIVYPEQETFPFAERTTYTAGAIVLAADALSDATPAAGSVPGRVAARLARPHRAAVGGATRLRSAQRAALAVLGELARLERRAPQLVGRTAAVGGVGEHVVDGEPPPDGHVRGPTPEVGPGRLLAVAAVDEAEVERGAPVRGDGGRVADEADDAAPRARPPSMVRRQKGSVSMRPVAGSTTSSSWWSQPGWFSSEPWWWSMLNSTAPVASAAAPR